ncbi:helix-turn-helix transcriptional regulator [Actinacidiphila yeochonensis]|uniref:helix-turn-helix transcriptional regulator n=1 Tax=Actinacidiphila yeochonensis TaxID=89050 RepID=UPI000D1B1186
MDGRGEAVEVRAALLRMRRSGLLPVAFGGLLPAGSSPPVGYGARQFRINELAGTATESLRGLTIATGNGLGGKTLAMGRPYAVTDYRSSRVISHEYDAAVAAEGLRSVLAVPVVAAAGARGAVRGAAPAVRPRRPAADSGDGRGARAGAGAAGAGRGAADAVVHAAPGDGGPAGVGGGPGGARRAEVAGGPGLGPAAAAGAADGVRAARGGGRFGGSCRRGGVARRARVRRFPRGRGARHHPPGGPPPLTPRELDVLSAISSGATNAVAAERLRLRPETVKSYLRSAMRKLGAHTRLEALVAARRAGLLP